VIGAAFSAIINSLVSDIINPLIAAIVEKPDFSFLVLTVHGGKIKYGNFLNAVIQFLLVAAAVYFIVVLPIGKVLAKFKPVPPAPPALRQCPECLSDIPVAAHRCSHCGQPVAPVPAAA
jgi:large conductance mechanosensitive channel